MADELSTFDPETFMDTSFDQGSMSTSIILPPAQDWTASISKLTARKFTMKDSGEDRATLDIQWCIENESCQKATNQDKSFAKQTLWLDFKTVNSQTVLDFDEGKNVGLGRLREALGQNKKGAKWQPGMLLGGVGLIKVIHRPDKNDPETKYAEVTRVAAI